MKTKQNRDIRLELRLTQKEYKQLQDESAGYKTLSEYVRHKTFDKGIDLVDPKELIRTMDELYLEMKRIGNNINQFAHYVNSVETKTPDNIILEFDKLLSDYVSIEKRLNITWRKFMKG